MKWNFVANLIFPVRLAHAIGDETQLPEYGRVFIVGNGADLQLFILLFMLFI